jgi:hypothetical protein
MYRRYVAGWFIVVTLCGVMISVAAAETLYVDGRQGNDVNPGTLEGPLKTLGRAAELVNANTESGPTTVKVAPGIYEIAESVVFENARPYTEENRLIIEATALPDDPKWTPDMMPIVISTEDPRKQAEPNKLTMTYGLKIKISHVTIRGLKFLGNPLPNNWYGPLECLGNNLKDVLVTQCLFAGDPDTLDIYCAVISDGSQFVVDHCIFHGCHACAVFWDGNRGIVGKQNAMRYCIVEGALIAGVWTCSTDEDFEFHHNIIARSEYFWMRKRGAPKQYRVLDCVITDNKHYSGYGVETGPTGPTGPEITYSEKNVVKQGNVVLEKKKTARNYLHTVPGTLGRELGAGLFKK